MKEYDFVPQRDKVLVKIWRRGESEGGIVLPEVQAADPLDQVRGTVVAIGDWVGKSDSDSQPPSKVKVGDRVCFGPYVGLHVRINPKDIQNSYKLIGIADIVGIEYERRSDQ